RQLRTLRRYLLSTCSITPPTMLSLSRFFFPAYAHLRRQPPFPTRRSSDLAIASVTTGGINDPPIRVIVPAALMTVSTRRERSRRSEEHTSELQSHLNLVCRLLLEKKIKRGLEPGSIPA